MPVFQTVKWEYPISNQGTPAKTSKLFQESVTVGISIFVTNVPVIKTVSGFIQASLGNVR